MFATIKCPLEESRSKTTENFVHRIQAEISGGLWKKQNLVWLELCGCAGNIISLLNGEDPGFAYLLTQMTNFIYSNSLIAAQGNEAMDQLFDMLGKNYILVVEGAVSHAGDGAYNIIGKFEDSAVTGLSAAKKLGEGAAHVIAMGSCASHGGVSAARPNPGGCTGIQEVLQRTVIKLPGCPCHPDWFMGTLAHILLYGEPALDDRGRPMMFYSHTVHERCSRRSYFDKGIFASRLGEPTCMFKMGCRGPSTHSDCPIRKWNGHVNWPVQDDTPCIGCAKFGFPDASEPFITYNKVQEE